jgi:hypothetical protein
MYDLKRELKETLSFNTPLENIAFFPYFATNQASHVNSLTVYIYRIIDAFTLLACLGRRLFLSYLEVLAYFFKVTNTREATRCIYIDLYIDVIISARVSARLG